MILWSLIIIIRARAVYWTVEWRFPSEKSGPPLIVLDHHVKENTTIRSALRKTTDISKTENAAHICKLTDHLGGSGLDTCHVYLRKEMVPVS